jgi:integrase/recombinase XerC
VSASETTAVDDPVGYFLEDMELHGKTARTRRYHETVLRRFESFLADPRGPLDDPASVHEATRRHCMAFVHHLREDCAPGTVATYAAYVHRFYDYMTRVGAFDHNPMALVMDELDESVDRDPVRRDVCVPEMRRFVCAIAHPLDRALVLTMLKTGVRVGELCNLDLRDLGLSDGLIADEFDVDPRPAIDGQPRSLFVSPDPERGGVHNGEERTASNKRERPTVVPVDDELAATLRRWLAVRPDVKSSAEPLFARTASAWGERVTTNSVRRVVTDHASARGWHRSGGGSEENVTPHYFRHFFTTHLRDRTGDRGVVKYLRGDAAGDVVDTYTHNWGDQVRRTYETNVYRLLDRPKAD